MGWIFYEEIRQSVKKYIKKKLKNDLRCYINLEKVGDE
jgi:hypothetical protein